MYELNFLLVEDELVSSVYIQHLMLQQGFKSQAARTGIDAIERFKSPDNRFDYVLLDIHLPDMTGIEIVKEMRAWEIMQERKEEQKAIIIGMSSLMNAKLRQECLESGMQAAFHKPFTKEQILKIVKDHGKKIAGYEYEKYANRHLLEAIRGIKIV